MKNKDVFDPTEASNKNNSNKNKIEQFLKSIFCLLLSHKYKILMLTTNWLVKFRITSDWTGREARENSFAVKLN